MGHEGDQVFLAKDCLCGSTVVYNFKSGIPEKILKSNQDGADIPYTGPGLIDLQINGVNGVDFNTDAISEEGLISAAGYLLGKGVTTFFPTVITNSEKNICKILSVIDRACHSSPLLSQCIGGIHLEGPFISREDGYRGAHRKRFVKAPDWELFCRFQKASGGRIKIITMSPEWENADDFIRRCRNSGILIGIAHSMAGSGQVSAAVRAGARLASHLGNSVPVVLPRHNNIIWDLLADDNLYASIVADGFHLPEPFIRVVIKTKKRKAVLISDATCFAGMLPGEYRAHIGGNVILGRDGSLRIKGGGGLLAGSARLLIDNVQHLTDTKLADISTAWHMASAGPSKLLSLNRCIVRSTEQDRVVFTISKGRIIIQRVYKNGVTVFP